jgi:hypothetical protein
MVLTTKMTFIMSHIYREVNQCAKRLANLCLHLSSYQWWETIPLLRIELDFLNIDFVNC